MSCLKKSFTFIVILLCFISIDANAQILHFGAKVGLNLANVTGIVSSGWKERNQQLKPGVVVGAYMTYDLLPLLSIQPEVLYSMKGAKLTLSDPPDFENDLVYSYDYIEIPVVLKFNLPLGPAVPFRMSVFAGPDFAFNVAANQTLDAHPANPMPTYYDLRPSTRPFDFNLAIGAGAGYDVGPTNLSLELQYTFGTGRINRSGTENLRSGVFTVIAGVGI